MYQAFSLDDLGTQIDSATCSSSRSTLSDDGSETGSNQSTKSAASLASMRMDNRTSRRFSARPVTLEDDGAEMEEEILKSKTSHECNLSSLRLSALPSGVPLATLVKISLSENTIKTLPEAMFSGQNCMHLRELDVNSNVLESLPQSLFYLPNLQVLMLNHNRLQDLPPLSGSVDGKALLPKIIRIGFEFNNLKRLPVEFFEFCPLLDEILLGQNEPMLNEPVPSDRLKNCIAAQQYASGKSRSVLLKADNRPRFMAQMQAEKWHEQMPWLTVDLHKIYPDRVLGFLFLGSLRTAQTPTVYHDLDIGFVLTVGRDLEVVLEPGMKHLVLAINDFPEENMTVLLNQAFDFIDEARAAGKGVLIHCFAGLSRSVTVAAAYIMKTQRMTRDEAMTLIKASRPAARPNEGFLRELLNLEKTYGIS